MKNVLLIGASGGLGHYISQGLAASGFNLAIHYNQNSDGIKKTEAEISGKAAKTKLYKADITDENSVKIMIDSVKNDFGSIDILINNAGLSINAMSWKMNLDDWNKVIEVNLTGPFICTKHTLPLMKENNFGRIIYISSVVPQIGVAGTSAYSATKAALSGLCKTISKETLKNNITVNVISLGYFEAGLLFQIPEDIRNQIKESIPVKKFGDPLEVVECIEYICSDKASYLRGQTININGGMF
jgi:NAD(P)-dependent dehydrogenase (short-subunit alcohol dehydrogenase family)